MVEMGPDLRRESGEEDTLLHHLMFKSKRDLLGRELHSRRAEAEIISVSRLQSGSIC
jgi:hypothetical protein